MKLNDIIFKEGVEIIIDKLCIVNIFNDYFVNIVNYIEVLSEEVYGIVFVDYLSVMVISGSVSFSFFFLFMNFICVK